MPAASVVDPGGELLSELQLTIAERLEGWESIRIARGGRLTARAEGHPVGTPYVVIQADNAMNRDIARVLLQEYSGTSDLAWEHGWTGLALGDGQRVTELTLYPLASAVGHVG